MLFSTIFAPSERDVRNRFDGLRLIGMHHEADTLRSRALANRRQERLELVEQFVTRRIFALRKKPGRDPVEIDVPFRTEIDRTSEPPGVVAVERAKRRHLRPGIECPEPRACDRPKADVAAQRDADEAEVVH